MQDTSYVFKKCVDSAFVEFINIFIKPFSTSMPHWKSWQKE